MSTDKDTGEKEDRLKAPIKNIMIPASVCRTAGPQSPVPEIIDIMTTQNVSSVILEEKSKPIGIITAQDILRHYLR